MLHSEYDGFPNLRGRNLPAHYGKFVARQETWFLDTSELITGREASALLQYRVGAAMVQKERWCNAAVTASSR